MKFHQFLVLLFSVSLWISGLTAFAETVEELFKQGEAADDAQNYVEAEKIWRRIIERDAKNDRAYTQLCDTLDSLDQLDRAIVACRQAIQLNSQNSRAYFLLGSVLRRQGQLEEAIQSYHKAIEINPESANAYNGLGTVLYYQGQLEEAIKNYKKAIEINPEYAYAYNNLANVLYYQGQLEEAIKNYKKAIEINPEDADNYHNLGVALYDQGKLEEAITSYQKAIEINPESADAYNNLGNALRQQGKLDEAITSYQKAIEINPKDAVAYNNLGNALSDQGKLDEAIKSYQKAIEINPKDAVAYNNLGNALSDQGKLEEAITSYQKAIEINPEYAKAYHNLGVALSDQGQLEEAITSYQKAIEINPEYAKAYHNLGNALYNQGQLEEAITSYKKALNLPDQEGTPTNVHTLAHNNLGYALQQQDKLQEAIAEYNKAIALDPEFVIAQNNLKEAEQQLVRQNPPPPSAINDLAYLPSLEDEPLRNILRSTALIVSQTSSSQNQGFEKGAGWVVKREGDTVWIITCRHVVADQATKRPNTEIKVEFFSQLEDGLRPRYEATIVKISSDHHLDLALLKVTGVPNDIKPLEMDDSYISRNTVVRAIGHPFNNPDPWNSSSGEVTNYNPNTSRFSIDANVAKGNSGGPVIHAETQKVIGIMVYIYREGDIAIDSEEIAPNIGANDYATGRYGMAYPVEVVIEFLRQSGLRISNL